MPTARYQLKPSGRLYKTESILKLTDFGLASAIPLSSSRVLSWNSSNGIK